MIGSDQLAQWNAAWWNEICTISLFPFISDSCDHSWVASSIVNNFDTDVTVLNVWHPSSELLVCGTQHHVVETASSQILIIAAGSCNCLSDCETHRHFILSYRMFTYTRKHFPYSAASILQNAALLTWQQHASSSLVMHCFLTSSPSFFSAGSSGSAWPG